MSTPHRSPDQSSGPDRPPSGKDEHGRAPSFDDALRGDSRHETVDPADLGHGGRIEADRIPPEPIAPSRRWTLGAFVPVVVLIAAVAAAIYVWMRA